MAVLPGTTGRSRNPPLRPIDVMSTCVSLATLVKRTQKGLMRNTGNRLLARSHFLGRPLFRHKMQMAYEVYEKVAGILQGMAVARMGLEGDPDYVHEIAKSALAKGDKVRDKAWRVKETALHWYCAEKEIRKQGWRVVVRHLAAGPRVNVRYLRLLRLKRATKPCGYPY
jgi:hypothetical protein